MDFAVILLLCGGLLFAIYCLFPTWYFMYLKKPFHATDGEKLVVLTFDDGPDPRYTDRLLDILEEYSVRAIFFVVAEKAAQFPEIVKRIACSGHRIGLHSLEHRDAWTSGPAHQKMDFERGLTLLNKLGCNVSLYRAPWGHLTLTSLWLAKKHKVSILLWTVMAQDWERNSTRHRVVARLLKRVKRGDIICLHDAGGGPWAAAGAPEHTLQAISEFLPLMLNKGFRFTVDME